MAKKLDDRTVDKRVAHRYLTEGEFTEAEWNDHLSNLEDSEGRSEVLEIKVGAKDAMTDEPEPEPDFDAPAPSFE